MYTNLKNPHFEILDLSSGILKHLLSFGQKLLVSRMRTSGDALNHVLGALFDLQFDIELLLQRVQSGVLDVAAVTPGCVILIFEL